MPDKKQDKDQATDVAGLERGTLETAGPRDEHQPGTTTAPTVDTNQITERRIPEVAPGDKPQGQKVTLGRVVLYRDSAYEADPVRGGLGDGPQREHVAIVTNVLQGEGDLVNLILFRDQQGPVPRAAVPFITKDTKDSDAGWRWPVKV